MSVTINNVACTLEKNNFVQKTEVFFEFEGPICVMYYIAYNIRFDQWQTSLKKSANERPGNFRRFRGLEKSFYSSSFIFIFNDFPIMSNFALSDVQLSLV